jgi:hypothetical protein
MRRSSAALAGVAVLVLAGCGGGGGGQRLGRDAYLTKANAVCSTANAALRKVPAPVSISGIPAYVDRALPALDRAISRLHAFRPPAALQKDVDRWLSALAELRSTLAADRSAAGRNDAKKVAALGAAGASTTRRANALASSIGLTDCARSR